MSDNYLSPELKAFNASVTGGGRSKKAGCFPIMAVIAMLAMTPWVVGLVEGSLHPEKAATRDTSRQQAARAQALKDANSAKAAVPNGPGVYAIFIRGGAAALAKSGYVEDAALPIWRQQDAEHIYTGESYGMRSRLMEHVAGDVGASTLRETLFALQWGGNALPSGPHVDHDRAASEKRLNDWLRAHAIIGYRSCGYVYDVEPSWKRLPVR